MPKCACSSRPCPPFTLARATDAPFWRTSMEPCCESKSMVIFRCTHRPQRELAMRLDVGKVRSLVGDVEDIDPTARVEVHGHDPRPSIRRIGRQSREAHPLPGSHGHVGPDPQVDDGRRRKATARKSPELHGRISAVARAVGVGRRARAVQPAAVRRLALVPRFCHQAVTRGRGLRRDVHACEVGGRFEAAREDPALHRTCGQRRYVGCSDRRARGEYTCRAYRRDDPPRRQLPGPVPHTASVAYRAQPG